MATNPSVKQAAELMVPPVDGQKSTVSNEKVKVPRFPADIEPSKPKRGKKSTLTPEQAAAKQRERRERFLKYAAKRVNGTLRRLKQVKALANKAGYEYTPEEAKKICDVLFQASADVGKAFAGAKDKVNEFSL